MELSFVGDDMALDISIGSLDEFEEDGVNVQCSNAVNDGRFTIDDGVDT
jgi:hypothetical protein